MAKRRAALANHNDPSSYLRNSFFKALFDPVFQRLVFICDKCERRATT